ncbi:MAG: O-antigen ligase family protein, partial [Bradymonadales bacterium]
FGLFAGSMTVSSIYSPSDSYVYEKLALLWLLLIYYLSVVVLEPSEIAWVIRVGAIFVLIAGTMYIGISRDLTLNRNEFDNVDPLLSLYLIVAHFAGLFLLFLISDISRLRSINSVLLISLFACFLLILGGRGPLIAVVLSMLIFWFNKLVTLRAESALPMRRVLMFSAVLVIALLALYVSSFFSENTRFLIERSSERFLAFNNVEHTTSFVERLDHISFILDYADSSIVKLLFGAGLGSYGKLWVGLDGPAHPHNIILEVFFEAGIVGTAFLMVLLSYIGLKVWRKFGGAGGAIWFFLIFNALKSSSLVEHRVLFMSFAMLVGAASWYVSVPVNSRVVASYRGRHCA